MTKKIIAIFTIAMFAGNIFAQKLTEGSLEIFLKNNVVVANIEMDFSNATIYGLNENDFLKFEPEWPNWKEEALRIFTTQTTSKLKDFYIRIDTNNSNSETTIKVVVKSVGNVSANYPYKGNFDSNIEILDRENNVVARIEKVFGHGGKYGTNQNLMNDGVERAAINFGNFLNNNLKKLKNNSAKNRK